MKELWHGRGSWYKKGTNILREYLARKKRTQERYQGFKVSFIVSGWKISKTFKNLEETCKHA